MRQRNARDLSAALPLFQQEKPADVMSRHPIGTAITTLAVTTIAIGPTTIPIVRQMGEAVPEAIQETDPIGHQTPE